MATNNRKDNHFFAIFHLFAFLSRVSLDKLYKRSFYFAEGNTWKVSTCFLCFHFCDEFRDDHAHAHQRPTGWCVRNWMPCLLTFQCLLSRVTFAQIFLNLAPSCDFKTSSRAVKTSRQTKSDTPPLLPPLHSIWSVLGPGGDNESDAITFMFFKYQNNIRQSPDQKILVGS